MGLEKNLKQDWKSLSELFVVMPDRVSSGGIFFILAIVFSLSLQREILFVVSRSVLSERRK